MSCATSTSEPSSCQRLQGEPSRCAAASSSFQQRRTGASPSAGDRLLLKFWPFFVELAFQKHYFTSTLNVCDVSCIPLNLVIWACCIPGTWSSTAELLTVLPPLLFELWCLWFRHRNMERYAKRRTACAVIRRLSVVPNLSFVLLRRPLQPSSSWQAALLCLWVSSGCAHTLAATLMMLTVWWVSAAALAVSAPLLWSAAPSACTHMLAGPYPEAGWRSAASLMDKAALGVYRGSLAQQDFSHAVCCTTLNTTLVVFSCLVGLLVHWLERSQRLCFKARMPPAVAAMQQHVYGLPTPLIVAQALLLLLYPAMVLGWLLLGAWHGLYAAGRGAGQSSTVSAS